MLKNAIAYILRKRNRTCIVFIILTLVLSFLYSCLNISKSTSNLEKNLYKISNTSLSITKNNGDTFETNQFKELDNIKEIKEIITMYDGLARTTNIKVVDGTQLIERDDLSDEFKNMLSVEATNNSEKDNLFSSGIFTIIKGRHIKNNDRGKILIHKELAEKNNLNINDKIKLELIDYNNNEKKMEYEFEIIGIFSGKKQEKYTGLSSDFSENMVFIDYESSQKALNKPENNKIVNKLEIYSDSSENTKVALNKIKEIKIDWSQLKVSSDNHIFEEKQIAKQGESSQLGGGAEVDGFNKTLTSLEINISPKLMIYVILFMSIVLMISLLISSSRNLRKSPKELLIDTK